MLQDVGLEMECYIIVEILAEMNAEFHMQVIEKTEAMKVLFYCALTKIHLHKYESFFKFVIFLSGDANLNSDLNANLNPGIYSNLSVISQKCESQNSCFKKTKHATFSEKQTFLTP